MGFEVDFLPVGDGEKSGDAIAIRYGNLFGTRPEQFVMVIDGGTIESGERLVEHVQDHYKTDFVDLVVNTHPDGDHASGLAVVLKALTVRRLWMHRPWEHSADIRHLFKNGRLTTDGLTEKMQKALEDAWDLEKLAEEKGIELVEPFSDSMADLQYPQITILGPSKSYYQSLLPHFRDLPDVKDQVAAWFSEGFGGFTKAAAALIERVLESWGKETLQEPEEDATSAENNTSVILALRIEGQLLLFTGDAGVPALTRAAAFAERRCIDLKTAGFQQMPHHGSKRNVGPSILDRIVGSKLAFPLAIPNMTVFVSAAKEGMPKHPAKKVINAYIRRGAKVLATQGDSIIHSFQGPSRFGWSAATPFSLFHEVEE